MMSTNISVRSYCDSGKFPKESDAVASTIDLFGLRRCLELETGTLHVFVGDDDSFLTHEKTISQILLLGKPVICAMKISSTGVKDPKLSKYIEELPPPTISNYPELYVIREGAVIFTYNNIAEFEKNLLSVVGRLLARWADRHIKFVDQPLPMYEVATDVIRNTKRRLVVVQRTPILLLGCRPYGEELNYPFEEEYLEVLTDWINDCKRDESEKEFIYFFDADETKNEIKWILENKDPEIHDRVREKLLYLYELEMQTNQRILVRSAEATNSMTVGDDWYGVWFMGRLRDGMAYTFAHPLMSDALAKQFKQIALKERNVELWERQKELGIG